MAGKEETKAEAIKIQGLIDRYLRFRSADSKIGGETPHLDEDLLTAFVEGRIVERESPAILQHLVDCSFCLHVTSELARLDYAFAEEVNPVAAPTGEPVKVSEVLSSLISRIFGASGGEVFAHHETKEEETAPEKTESKDKTDA